MLSDCLAFAEQHSTTLAAVQAQNFLRDRSSIVSSELQYRKAEPIFTADGRSARMKRSLPVDGSVLDKIQEKDDAGLIAQETRTKKQKKAKKGERPETAGSSHFDLPNTPVTPDVERAFKLLEMRPYIYKDQNYKKSMKWKAPSYFGLGTVVDDPIDFYSTRVPRKQRKQNLADEFLEDPALLQYVEKRQSVLDTKKAKLAEIRRKKSNPKKRAKIMYNRKAKKK